MPGKSHGWRSLVGCSPRGLTESDMTERLHFHFHALEKAMTPHSNTLAWKIPWMEEPGRLQSMGSLRVRHDWETSLSLSCIGEGNGNPLQCSCLENPRDGGAWWAAIYGVTQSGIRLKRLSSSSSSSVYMLIVNCQFIPPHPFPLGHHKFVFYVCEFISVFYISSFVLLFFFLVTHISDII